MYYFILISTYLISLLQYYIYCSLVKAELKTKGPIGLIFLLNTRNSLIKVPTFNFYR